MVELIINVPAQRCFEAFCDLASARHWLPDLCSLRVVRSDAKGRPLEVAYERGDSLSYALVYAYDDARRQVRWVPSAGALDGVSGFATFEPDGERCRFRYSLDSLRGRASEHPETVARVFAAWVERSTP